MSNWIDDRGRRHVGVMVNSKRIHRVLPEGATAGDAKLIEAQLRQAVGRKSVAIPSDPPMSAVLAGYCEYAQTLASGKTRIHHAKRAAPWAEKYTASQARECAAHIIKDMTGHYAPATINMSLAAMKKGLALAWEYGHTPENYGNRIKLLQVSNQREVVLTLDQVKAIVDHCSTPAKAAIWAALLTGARRGELCKIKAEHIGPDTITIPAQNTKTKKAKVVPISPALRPWLQHFPLQINFEGLKSSFRRARERAGLPHITFHDLRRTCATMMITNGIDLYTVSKVLGHSSVTVTAARYAHLQIEQQRKGLDAVSALVSAENYTSNYTSEKTKAA